MMNTRTVAPTIIMNAIKHEDFFGLHGTSVEVIRLGPAADCFGMKQIHGRRGL